MYKEYVLCNIYWKAQLIYLHQEQFFEYQCFFMFCNKHIVSHYNISRWIFKRNSENEQWEEQWEKERDKEGERENYKIHKRKTWFSSLHLFIDNAKTININIEEKKHTKLYLLHVCTMITNIMYRVWPTLFQLVYILLFCACLTKQPRHIVPNSSRVGQALLIKFSLWLKLG